MAFSKRYAGGEWRSTAAITRIALLNTLKTGSSFQLFGLS